jgi:3-oxoacyl-[acyl-carrier-protein] synthase II
LSRIADREADDPSPIIDGLGLITPLGGNVQSTWNALLAGRSIDDHSPADFSPPAGRARVIELAIAAARQAAEQAGLSAADRAATALVIATSKGPIEKWIEPPHGPGATEIRSARIDPSGLAEIAAHVAADLNLGGARLTICSACASGLHALIRAAIMIRSGEARSVLVVAAESSLHPLFIGSFNRLGVLAAAGHGCRPFDVHRDGFLISEAAAAVHLRHPGDVSPTAPLIVRLGAMSMLAEGYHITSPDPSGQVLQAMIRQTLPAGGVDLIHAHATATKTNDPIELAAVECCLLENQTRRRAHHLADQRAGGVPPTADIATPNIYSHKGALGHSLGAAGLSAVAINCMIHQSGKIPGNVRTTNPLPTQYSQIHNQPTERKVATSLTLAAGFGGPCAAIAMHTP